ILATAAAALISAGAMAASTSAADAHSSYKLSISGGYYITKYVSVPEKVCHTSYKTVLVGYDEYTYNPIYNQVAYESCKIVYVNVKQKVWVPYATYSSNYGLSLHLSY